MAPSMKEVEEFIGRFDHLYGGRLSAQHHYGRVVSLCWFYRTMISNGLLNQPSVGVISGDPHELEPRMLNFKNIEYLNFSEDRKYDLDVSWKDQQPKRFDITICNQVLEHIFNPHQAFENIIHHTRPGGLIWISVPTINCIHGEPYFYSSGYHPRFLERLAQANNLEIIGVSHWGSVRFLLHQVTGKWMSFNQLKVGLHTLEDCRFPNYVFSDGRDPNCEYVGAMGFGKVITDCWGLFRLPG